jgi:hypothetical protein
LNCKSVLPDDSGNIERHNTKIHVSQKITHNAETKHGTQSYRNNEARIACNEYNTKKNKAISATGREIL